MASTVAAVIVMIRDEELSVNPSRLTFDVKFVLKGVSCIMNCNTLRPEYSG